MDASQFYRLFRQAAQTYQLYPAESPVRAEASVRLARALEEAQQAEGVSIVFLDEGAFVDGQRLKPGGDETGLPLWRRLFELGVGELRFLPGTTPPELGRLFDLLARAQQGLLNPVDEDLSVLLWESELSHVTYWLYEDDSWLEQDLNEAGAGIGDEWNEILNASAEEGADGRLFVSGADQALSLEDGAAGVNIQRDVKAVPYRGLPLGEYLDEEVTIGSEMPTGPFIRLSEEERLGILSEYRRDCSEVVPWKYGRLLIEVLRLETEPADLARIEALLTEYVDALLEAERFVLLRALAGRFRDCIEDGSPAGLVRAEARLATPEAAGCLAAFLSEPRNASQRRDEYEAAGDLLAMSSLDSLLRLRHEAPEPVRERLDDLLRGRLRRDVAVWSECFASRDREVRLLALECPPDAPEVGRKLRDLAREGDAESRCLAIRALSAFVEPATLAILAGSLHDLEAPVRVAAAEALAAQGGPRSLEPLLRVLVGKEFERRDARERRIFFVAAGRAAPREVLPVLARLAEQRSLFGRHDESSKAEVAISALVELGDEAAPFLVERWATKHRDLLRRFERLRLAQVAQSRTGSARAA